MTSPSPIRPDLARRIVWEAEAVRARFPGCVRLLVDTKGLPAWHGTVPIEGRSFPVLVTYPAAYPAMPPRLETTLPLPPHCPHVLRREGGRATLCWIASHARTARRRWDPQRHTAATVLRRSDECGRFPHDRTRTERRCTGGRRFTHGSRRSWQAAPASSFRDHAQAGVGHPGFA